MRVVQKIGSNMASDKELFSEIPTKRARLQDAFSGSGHCSSNISHVNLSKGHGDEAPIDCITPSIQSENCENIHFPENLGGQGQSSLAEIALGSSTENEAENIQSPADEERTKNDEDESNDSWSTISDISGLSEDAWKPVSGPISWVQRQVSMGTDPRAILNEMLPSEMDLPNDLDNYSMWRLIINLLMEPPKRKKLENINTLEDVVHLLKTCKKIVVLTGAGVSVSCGIPDFRSRDGIYARLAVDFPNLPDPQAMFDIHFFKSDPRPFFKFAKEIYPGQFEASKCHKFIKLLDDHGKLLQNYTQNIDTLEQVAGIKSVIQCHGSFATAQCMACKHKVDAEVIREDIFNQVIPICPVCPPDTPFAVMKPNIVFFGESLPEEFHRQMAADKDECDLLIVIGSSLKVRPVALIPNSLPANVPQILINRERLCHIGFDVELLGDCDVIVNELCKRLGEGWEDLCNDQPSLHQLNKSDLSGDSRGHCANIANSYSDSCELRADTCLATSDSNSSDVTLQMSNTDSKNDSSGTIINDDISNKCLENNRESSSEQFHDANDSVEETTIRHSIESTDESTNHMKSCFQSPQRQSLAKGLKNDQFLFVKPNRYVFTGAEVYSDDSDDDSDGDSVDEKSESDQNDNSVSEKDNSMDSDNKDEKIVTTINNDNVKENYEISVSHIPVIDIAANSVS